MVDWVTILYKLFNDPKIQSLILLGSIILIALGLFLFFLEWLKNKRINNEKWKEKEYELKKRELDLKEKQFELEKKKNNILQ